MQQNFNEEFKRFRKVDLLDDVNLTGAFLLLYDEWTLSDDVQKKSMIEQLKDLMSRLRFIYQTESGEERKFKLQYFLNKSSFRPQFLFLVKERMKLLKTV